MTMIITEDCINCSACAVECPKEAILEPNKDWVYKGNIFEPLSMEHFFIVTEFCDECSGINEIKCIAICPMNAVQIKET